MKKDIMKSMLQISKITQDMTKSTLELNSIKDAVTIFGSARLREGDKAYDDCVKLAKKLGEHGISIFTGGGPGIMEAGNKGASESCNPEAKSVAIGVELPNEQGLNSFANVKLEHKYFATRKIHLTAHSNIGFIGCYGGLGTLDEIFEIACLINTKKIASQPIVLIGDKFYGPMIEWLKTVVSEEGVLTPEEVDEAFILAKDWEAAADIILNYQAKLTQNVA